MSTSKSSDFSSSEKHENKYNPLFLNNGKYFLYKSLGKSLFSKWTSLRLLTFKRQSHNSVIYCFLSSSSSKSISKRLYSKENSLSLFNFGKISKTFLIIFLSSIFKSD